MSAARLDLDTARVLEADTIARAARLQYTSGGRQCFVLYAVLRLTAGYRKAADWVALPVIARLAFGLDRDAHVTRSQWLDTAEALRMWTRRGVIRTLAPHGRPAADPARRRYWVCIDLDEKRTPPPGALATETHPEDGCLNDEKAPGEGRLSTRRRSFKHPEDGCDSPDLSPDVDLSSLVGDSRANGVDPDAGEPRSPEDELADLTDRFAQRIAASRERLGRHENRDAVAALITAHGTVLVRRWLEADHPLARYVWPSDAVEAAEAWIAAATDPLAIPWDEEAPPP
jgi:hypothetical protein